MAAFYPVLDIRQSVTLRQMPLIRFGVEEFCSNISASREHDTLGSPNPYDRHNASVSQTTKSARKREGRYRPTRSKTFIDRLQTAKREKKELKIKSMDFSTAHKKAYIAGSQ